MGVIIMKVISNWLHFVMSSLFMVLQCFLYLIKVVLLINYCAIILFT